MPERLCDRCHIRMSPYRPRKRNADTGEMLCEGCENGREGRPLTGSKMTPQPLRVQAKMIRTAHGVMDGVTVMHCLEGSTRFWTYDGLRTLEETAGTEQKVLTSSGNWVDAHIHSFGEQPLMKVTVRRNKRERTLYATPGHRWIIRTGRESQHEGIVTTENLRAEHRLANRIPKSRIGQTTPSQFGIAAGFVYGDGFRSSGGSAVNLWGDKDAQMMRYFTESPTYPRKTPNGVLGTHVSSLPGFFKDLPSLSESTAYLYGWMAGYFAADGSVSSSGQVIMTSASRENLEFVQLVAMRLGIGTYDIVGKERQGYGDEPSTLYQMQFVGSSLRSNFFLTKIHRERFDAAQESNPSDRIGWTVVSVEKTDRVEEVFCAVVPGTESFVLDGLILSGNCPFCGSGQVISNSDGTIACGFCSQTFTVLVQPQHPMAPQTVDGQPYPPGSKEQTPEDAAAQNDPDALRDEKSFGGEDLSDKTSDDDAPPPGDDGGNPFAKKDDDKKKDDSDGPPPGIDKDSMLVTTGGVALPVEEYMAHLALSVTEDPRTTVHEVRSHRRED